MSSQEEDLMPSAIEEMPKAELEDFDVSGRVQPIESTVSYSRDEKASLSIPMDQVADEETAKPQFALPDELLAKVLGYLPLRDRFRLETVCRQWQRCMYLEVEDMYLSFHHKVAQKYTLRLNNVGKITSSWTEELPAVLHKLRISKVCHLRCNIEVKISHRELFVLLADIASRATEVVVAYGIIYSPDNFATFCEIIGPYVTTFLLGLYQWQGLHKDIHTFENTLSRKMQLRELGINWLDFFFTCLNSFPPNSLPHFQEIELVLDYECNWNMWEHFKSLYGAQIKKIKFHNEHLLLDKGEALLPLKDMAPFANLEHLDFRFRLHDCTWTDLAKDLEATSRSCPLVKSLGLRQANLTDSRFIVSLSELRNLFVAIGKMKMLEKLDLYLTFYLKDLEDIISSRENLDLFALLENKSNITHLKAYVKLYPISSRNKRIRPEIWGSLNKAMPNLMHADVFCMATELDHFVGLKRLQTITLNYCLSSTASRSIQDSLIRILKSSPALRNIKVCHGFAKVSDALIRTIMEVARLQMQKHIDFVAEFRVLNKYKKTWDARKHLAPRNLTLILEEDMFEF